MLSVNCFDVGIFITFNKSLMSAPCCCGKLIYILLQSCCGNYEGAPGQPVRFANFRIMNLMSSVTVYGSDSIVNPGNNCVVKLR